jgi:hypothetical protein
MLTKEQIAELKKLNEETNIDILPKEKKIEESEKSEELFTGLLKESYLDAKTEFSEPFIVKNMKGVSVMAINISGGKTYYMTPETAKSYISSMEQIIGELEGGAVEEDFEIQESVKKKLDEEFRQNDLKVDFAVRQDGTAILFKFNSKIDDEISKILKGKFGANYDQYTGILKIDVK